MTHSLSLDRLISRSDRDRKRLDAVLAALPDIGPDGPWLAGGALRRVVSGMPLSSDFDFFFRDVAQSAAFQDDLKKRGATKKATNEHAVTWTLKVDDKQTIVQCITMAWYATPAALIDSFDFTLCQLAYDGAMLHCGDYALWDIGRKRLAVHKITYAVSSVRRFLKYSKQGYTVCSGAIESVLRAVIEDPSKVHAELEYVD